MQYEMHARLELLGMGNAMTTHRCRQASVFLLLAMGFANGHFGSVAYAAGESPKDVIAAQIRIQGFACDRPLRAVLDKRRSRPDHDVWVLKCENATYRFSRYPDMAAKVEVLR
jgi:hypothetical protein